MEQLILICFYLSCVFSVQHGGLLDGNFSCTLLCTQFIMPFASGVLGYIFDANASCWYLSEDFTIVFPFIIVLFTLLNNATSQWAIGY